MMQHEFGQRSPSTQGEAAHSAIRPAGRNDDSGSAGERLFPMAISFRVRSSVLPQGEVASQRVAWLQRKTRPAGRFLAFAGLRPDRRSA